MNPSINQQGGMLIVTTENLAGHRITEVKGQVFGLVVRSRGLAGNILAGLRSIIGGEITEYTQLLARWHRHRSAESLGAAWQPTAERFVDPESGQALQVLFNPHTGERRYEPAPAADDGTP